MTRTFLGAVTRLAVATDVGEVTVDAVDAAGPAGRGGQGVAVRLDTTRVRAAT